MPICPFCHFERSNAVGRPSPLPCDAPATHTRCKACSSVADIDAKIEQACQNLMDMQAERLRLLSEVNHTHDQLSERFPVEILSNIFQHCPPDWETQSTSTDGWLASVPLRLSQVSRRWRTISHSISQLWAILPLYVRESQEFSLGAICDVAREWLARSGECNSLFIILDIDGKVDLRAKHSFPIFSALKSIMNRVRHLHIRASAPILHHMCHLGGKITELQLRCVNGQWGWAHSHSHLDSCGEVEPTALYIDGTSWTNFRISLEHLTHLKGRTMSFLDMFTILQDAPHLVICNLARPTDHREPALPHEPLVKPTLKHLYLHERMRVRSAIFILSAFTFPSLQSLCLQSSGRHSIPLMDVITHLLRSGSHLEKLWLRGLSSDDLGPSSLLPQIIGPITGRSLRHLEVTGNLDWDGLDDWSQLASILEAASAYLPSLQTLRLYSHKKDWVHALQKVLSAISAITSVSMQPLSAILWFNELPVPIDEETRDSGLDAIYDKCLPLTATELREIMSTMKHHRLISVTMSYNPWPFYYSDDATSVRNITEEVMVTLARLLHDSRSEQLY